MNDIVLNWKRIPAQSKRFTYQVCEDGRIIRTTKKRCAESRVAAYLKKGKPCVKIANKEYYVKQLVAQAFLPGYKKGDTVLHKDGDITNCHVNNLFIISKSEHGKITGGDSRRCPVIANGVEYYSVRECAKALYCSYQTLSDYLNGKVKHSVLSGINIRYINN